MHRQRNARRAVLLLMVLAAAFMWTADAGIRAAAADRAESSAPPASAAAPAVNDTTAAAPPPAAPAKADASAKTADKTDATAKAADKADAATTVADPATATTADAAAAAEPQAAKGKTKVTRDQVFPEKFQKVAPSEQKAASIRAAKAGMKPGVAGRKDLAGQNDLMGAARVTPADFAGTTEGPGGIPHYFGPFGNVAFSPLPRGGVANTVAVVDGGTGYTVPPIVEITDAYGTATVPATATAAVAAGAVTSVTIDTPGEGYTVPIVGFIAADGGTGAVAEAELDVATLTGGLKKFVDPLKDIPVGVPDVVTYPGSDYYEIALREYPEQMSSQLPATTLRGYVQVNNGTDTSACDPAGMPSDPPKPVCTAANNTVAPAPISYLGPIIIAKGRVHGIQVEGPDPGDPKPVRVKFINQLPIGSGGNLFLPVDESVPGSGLGPALPGAYNDKFTQNRATIHLHGNNTVWLSDGNVHQWITPAGEDTPYPAGTSARNVPDMEGCASDPAEPLLPGTSGCMNFYYTNAQSARLQFYHDHAHGITRLNVYAGEAAGYLLTDAVEQDMINGTNVTGVNPGLLRVLPDIGIPLVIQDRTFVDKETVFAQDPTWNWGTGPRDPATGNITDAVTGDLWFPHVYMTVQNPWDLTGTNAFGKWHYGPWFNPPTPVCPGDGSGAPGCIEAGPVPNEYADPANPGYSPLEPPMRPGVPNPSSPGEAFLDTPIVNGVAYPYLDVPAGPVRFRILNAANDRFLNLQLYEAFSNQAFNFGTGVENPPTATQACSGYADCTEVKMVPVTVNPLNQFADTPSGIPDPVTAGPPWWLIGTEGGFMPKPVEVPQQPVGWNLDMGYFAFGIVNQHSIFLGSAERADVVVDFSAHAGKTFILYNDSPAPVPAGAGVFDFYTGNGHQMDAGGAPNTLPGYGPNTRTIMQIRVGGAEPKPDVTFENLEAVFAKTATKRGVFEVSQDPIIVPQAAYNSAYNDSFPTSAAAQFLQIGDMEKTFTPIGGTSPVTIPLEMKAMHDEMGGVYDVMYGRMSGMLGLVNPTSNVHLLIPYPYAGPPVDLVKGSAEGVIQSTPMGTLADGTQIWRIFHNGVDTHPIHTHLFHTQIVNRVDQSGQMVGDAVDPIEHGWKDTVRINPLEVTFLAMRPTVPTPDQVPFEVPDSIRLIDPSLPEGATLPPPSPAGWFDPQGTQLEGTAVPVNHYVNFGWEYVWHCHILSHEEMDMMHALVFAVPPRPPAITGAVWNGSTGGNRRVTVTFTDNSIKEAGYTVQRATNAAFTVGLASFDVAAQPGSGGPVTYVDGSIANNNIYYYRVIAKGETVGDTFTPNFPTMSADVASGAVSVLVGATPGTPTAPTNLAAALQSGPRVSLTWRDNATNETGFAIERCTGAGCTDFLQIASAGPRNNTGNVTYVDTTVAFGNTYLYRVAAANGTGMSAYSNTATVSVAAVPDAPASFTAVNSATPVNGPNTRVTLTWSAVAGAANYTIQRATMLDFGAGETGPAAANLATFTVTGTGPLTQTVKDNTTYYYRIRANNSVGGSSAWKNALPFPIRTGR